MIGNTGTTIGSGNFLGTIDNSDFLIKANNQYKILVSAATSNLTLFGDTNFGRGGGNQWSNIAFGNQALQLNSA